MTGVGVVVIGRNEGQRLRTCLRSLDPAAHAVVYVDSGSTDGSVDAARSAGAEVVELDLTNPFTAARARNVGFERLIAIAPATRFVQFVDGDCEIAPGWLEAAAKELESSPDVVAVAGTLRERFPDASVYNRLCDLEWDAPAGEAREVGGNAMWRADAFREAGGFRATLIAGEEPELCHRVRARGRKVMRLAQPMGWHDAAMTRFRQWWRRNVRSGHAYAECARLHRRDAEPLWRREVRRNWFWGVLLPAVAALAAPFTAGLSLMLLLAYPAQAARVYRGRRRHGDSRRAARLYAVYCLLANFPQALGQARFHLRSWLARPPRILEYKTPQPPSPAA